MSEHTDTYPTVSAEELIVAVSFHPRLYVGDDSFRVVASYIDGFFHGRGGDDYREVKAFYDWLAYESCRRFRTHPYLVWFSCIQGLFPSDEDALRALPNLWFHFKAGKSLRGIRLRSLVRESKQGKEVFAKLKDKIDEDRIKQSNNKHNQTQRFRDCIS